MSEHPVKRAKVSLETKAKILEDVSNKLTEAQFCQKHGISKGVVARAKHMKDDVSQYLENPLLASKSRMTTGRFKEIDDKVIEFHNKLYNKGFSLLVNVSLRSSMWNTLQYQTHGSEI